jgi:hypothetical protein
VDDVNVFVPEQLVEIRIANFDIEVITHGVELLLVALTDRVAVGVGMFLPKGDEFRSKTQTDDCDIDLFCAHLSAFVWVNEPRVLFVL